MNTQLQIQILIWCEFTSKHSDLENLKTAIIRKQQEREEEEKVEEQDTDCHYFSQLVCLLTL
jgi:hypothetical protein